MNNESKEIHLPVDVWQLEILRLSLSYFKLTPECIDEQVKHDVDQLEDFLAVYTENGLQ